MGQAVVLFRSHGSGMHRANLQEYSSFFECNLLKNLPEMKTGVILEKESVDRFKKAVDMLDESIQELRRVAHHMMPESLIRFGLKASLADFCSAIPNADFHYYGNEKRLDSRLEILLYRSVHELVNNAIKHAEAEKIDVQIIQEEDRLSLVV